MRYLITGGSGYFGGELKRALLAEGHTCINVDIAPDNDRDPNLISEIVDISQPEQLQTIFEKYAPFDAVFHAAAQLQCTRSNKKLFYATNIDAAQYLVENSIQHKVPNFIFISSNCVYGKMDGIHIQENHSLQPFEAYGKTKVQSEKILESFKDKINIIIFRPPTIIGEGRLGILSIVFDFIRENRKLWLVGSGTNRYQFIYSNDLIDACKLAAEYKKSAIFNIGCDNVPSLNELFEGVIQAANSQSVIKHIPQALAVPGMKLAFKLGISPLGPYQYNMIANTFIGDTTKLKNELGWRPTKSNIEMLVDNYRYYDAHYHQIHTDAQLSGHRKAGKAGVLALIKKFS